MLDLREISMPVRMNRLNAIILYTRNEMESVKHCVNLCDTFWVGLYLL